MVMDNPFPISEYRERLEVALVELSQQSLEAHRSADERARLAAKATGVSLALSYWDEHEPAPAPAGGGDSAISERTTDLYPYLVVGVETGHDPHRTLHGAVADAEGRIDDCLDDTWSEEVDEILVARVTHRAVRNVMGRRADMTPEAWTELTGGRTDVDEWWSYSLEPVDQLDAGAPAALAETVEPTETNPCGEQPIEAKLSDPIVAAAARRTTRVRMAQAIPGLEQVDASLVRSGEPQHRAPVVSLIDTFRRLVAEEEQTIPTASDVAPTTIYADQIIVTSDYFNAWYLNGQLGDEGKPERLDGETLGRLYPQAAWYEMPADVYDEILDGAGYPARFEDLPVDRLRVIRAGF